MLRTQRTWISSTGVHIWQPQHVPRKTELNLTHDLLLCKNHEWLERARTEGSPARLWLVIFGERFGGSVEDETYVLKTEWPRLSKRRLWAQSQRDHGDRMTGRAKTSVDKKVPNETWVCGSKQDYFSSMWDYNLTIVSARACPHHTQRGRGERERQRMRDLWTGFRMVWGYNWASCA